MSSSLKCSNLTFRVTYHLGCPPAAPGQRESVHSERTRCVQSGHALVTLVAAVTLAATLPDRSRVPFAALFTPWTLLARNAVGSLRGWEKSKANRGTLQWSGITEERIKKKNEGHANGTGKMKTQARELDCLYTWFTEIRCLFVYLQRNTF